MSLIPNTSLVVNIRNSDVISSQPDVVYMLAPANQGGEKRDLDDNILYDSNGRTLFGVSEPMYSLSEFEAEFGFASEGSPASIYAHWIYEYGNFAIRCRRVVSSDLAYATCVLKDAYGIDLLGIRSEVQDADANKIQVDVDVSSGVEGFLYTANAIYDSETQALSLINSYEDTDLLIMQGTVGLQQIFVYFFAQSGSHIYSTFDWTGILSARDENDVEYVFVGNNMAVSGYEFSYDTANKQLLFGHVIVGKVKIRVSILSGQTVEYEFVNVSSSVLSFDFVNFEFGSLYLNGVGKKVDITHKNHVRLYNNSVSDDIYITFLQNVVTNEFELHVHNSERSETFVYSEHIVDEINLQSRLIAAEFLIPWGVIPNYVNEVKLEPLGFKLTAYNGDYLTEYDNLIDAEDALSIDSGLIRVSLLGNKYAKPLMVMGERLSGGSAGTNPTMADYLEGLEDARSLKDVTIIIAPGVADGTLHAVLGDHCLEMFQHGKAMISFGGVALGEQVQEKMSRTSVINNERFVLIGDGLELKDPVTNTRQYFSGAMAVSAVVGKLLSQLYYESLTEKLLDHAYGIEHDYYKDDAQVNELHEARMILFKFDNGVKIIDGITTSTKNAYEDIYMVRVFDVISRAINQLMVDAVGKINMPPTWGYVLGKLQKFLETLVGVGAILDFKLLNEVQPQDIVDKRYKFRVGIVPVFPIKYIEGFVDIIPPSFT